MEGLGSRGLIMQKTILVVPGFVCDTYSSIEEMSIELCKQQYANTKNLHFIWLVPEINNRWNRFKKKGSRKQFTKPLYVQHLDKNGIDYIERNLSKFNIFKNFFIFFKLFKKYKIDAVYVQFGYERFFGAFFGKLFKKEVFWHEHWHSLKTKFCRTKNFFYNYFVDTFIAVSSGIAESLGNKKKIVVVNNAINPGNLNINNQKSAKELKKLFKIHENSYVILMIAAFRQGKRHDLAVKISEKVISHFPYGKVTFVFLGDGPYRKSIKKIIEDKNLSNLILIPGHVSNTVEYLNLSTLHMLTSESKFEGLPMCLLEAMLFSLPLIAFNVDGPDELITDNGYLIPFGDVDRFADKIIELIENSTLRNEMGQNSFNEFNKRFHINVWREKMYEVFLNHV